MEYEKDFTNEQLLEAIKGSRGNYSIIAEKLKTLRHIAVKYIESHPELIRELENEKDMVIQDAIFVAKKLARKGSKSMRKLLNEKGIEWQKKM